MVHLFFITLWLLLASASASLVELYSCTGTSPRSRARSLAKFIVDVSIDNLQQKMNFYITLKVEGSRNHTHSSAPAIIDVNTFTNMYTTLHVELHFLSTLLVRENLRFCDLVSVKKTLLFNLSGRFYLAPLPALNGTRINQRDISEENRSVDPKGKVFNEPKYAKVDETVVNFPRIGLFDPIDMEVTKMNTKHETLPFDTLPITNWQRDLNTAPLVLQTSTSLALASSTALAAKELTSVQLDITIAELQKGSSSSGFNGLTFFYNDNSVHCPLYINDTVVFYYQADISKTFHQLGLYTASFMVVLNDENPVVLQCNKVHVTPVQSKEIRRFILAIVIAILLVTAGINFFTIMYLSYQESTNPLLFTASTICNEELLKQLENRVYDILLHLQFVLFLGCLGLLYPGFYQPLLSEFRWCALMGLALYTNKDPKNREEKKRHIFSDNVYLTYNGGGLQTLTAYYSNMVPVLANFFIALTLWICIQIVAKQTFYHAKQLVERWSGKNTTRLLVMNTLCLCAGEFIHNFLVLYSLPLLSLSFWYFMQLNKYMNSCIPLDSLVLEILQMSNTSYVDAKLGDPSGNEGPIVGPFNGSFNPHKTSRDLTNLPKNSTTIGANKDEYTSLGDVASIVMGAILVGLWCGLVAYFMFQYVLPPRIRNIWQRKTGPVSKVTKIYTSQKVILIWGHIYNQLDPQKLYFSALQFGVVVLRAAAIGLLQNHGAIQVSILAVSECLEFFGIILISPYYVKLHWYLSRYFLGAARILTTFLSIAYIKELDVSEQGRSYVAYLQLSIHSFVILIFVVQLIYQFVITIRSNFIRRQPLYKDPKNTKKSLAPSSQIFFRWSYSSEIEDEKPPLSQEHSFNFHTSPFKTDDSYLITSQKGFEYKAVGVPGFATKDSRCGHQDLAVDLHSGENSTVLESDYFFRGKGAGVVPGTPRAIDILPNFDSLSFSELFEQQKKRLEKRKLANDYTVREGDRIYTKFFADDLIDPEIQALWGGRDELSNPVAAIFRMEQQEKDLENRRRNRHPTTQAVKTPRIKIPKAFRKEKKGTGFEVSRPRQLVIKKQLKKKGDEEEEANGNYE